MCRHILENMLFPDGNFYISLLGRGTRPQTVVTELVFHKMNDGKMYLSMRYLFIIVSWQLSGCLAGNV